MNKILHRVAALLLALSGPAFAGAQEDALQVVGKWAGAFNASDVDAIVALYAPDARFMGTGSKTIVTKPAEVRDYFERALLTNRPRSATLLQESVQVLSDSAVIVTGLDQVSGVRDGQKVTANGRVTFVVALRDGAWKIVHFHRSAMPN